MALASKRLFLLLALFFSAAFSLVPASPAEAQLVPCGRSGGSAAQNAPCTMCHLVVGINEVMRFILRIMTIVAIAIIFAMGILYIVSAGNPGMIGMAKKGITAALIGFAIILAAFLIVNTVIRIISASDFFTGVGDSGVVLTSRGFSFVCDTSSSAGTAVLAPVTPGTAGPGGGGPITGGAVTPGQNCSQFEDDFQRVGTAKGVDWRLLKAIALVESRGSCSTSATSGQGACGLMQILPSSAGVSCSYLQQNPERSIEIAADILRQRQGELAGYGNTFDIGRGFSLSTTTVSFNQANPPVVYNAGNDDLIASYNAGAGNSGNDPFVRSRDCQIQGGRAIPAWQCPINPQGFRETQEYVLMVQATMNSLR